MALRARDLRCEPEDAALRARGISEAQALDFQSPYGCSKGAADQYVLDYARTFGLSAAVLRMSCIYGPRQLGSEEQGWVAHFAIQLLRGAPITIHGDGLQVRDALFVEDLVGAILAARAAMPRMRGGAWNLGGGPEQTTSLLELLELLHEIGGRRAEVRFEAARPGDQRWYVSDLQRFRGATGWAPRVQLREGLVRLCAFLRDAGIGGRVKIAEEVILELASTPRARWSELASGVRRDREDASPDDGRYGGRRLLVRDRAGVGARCPRRADRAGDAGRPALARAAARRAEHPRLALFASERRLEWMDDPWDDVARSGDWLLDLERKLRPDVVHLASYAHAARGFRAPTIVVAHSCVLSWWDAVFSRRRRPATIATGARCGAGSTPLRPSWRRRGRCCTRSSTTTGRWRGRG